MMQIGFVFLRFLRFIDSDLRFRFRVFEVSECVYLVLYSAIFCYIGLLEHIFGYFLASAGKVSVSGFRGLIFWVRVCVKFFGSEKIVSGFVVSAELFNH